MNRRVRFFGGLLASLAMTFSFSESVWASTCAPGMTMEAAATEMSSRTVESQQAPGDTSGGLRQSSRPCPFGSPLAAQACAGVASFPSSIRVDLSPSPERAAYTFRTVGLVDRVLTRTVFHPPRA